MHSASVTRPTDRLSRGRCASVTRPTDRLWDERAAARPSEEKKPPRPPASRHQLPPSPSAQQRRRATPSASSRRRRWLQLLRRSSMRTGPSFEAMAVAGRAGVAGERGRGSPVIYMCASVTQPTDRPLVTLCASVTRPTDRPPGPAMSPMGRSSRLAQLDDPPRSRSPSTDLELDQFVCKLILSGSRNPPNYYHTHF